MRKTIVERYGTGSMPPVVTGASAVQGLVIWFWLIKMVPLALSVMEGMWIFPVATMWVRVRPGVMMRCPWWGKCLRAVLSKMAEIIAVIAPCLRTMVINLAFLSTSNTSVTVGHHVHLGSDKLAVTCCVVFSSSTNLTTSNKVYWSFSYTFSATLCVSLRPFKGCRWWQYHH